MLGEEQSLRVYVVVIVERMYDHPEWAEPAVVGVFESFKSAQETLRLYLEDKPHFEEILGGPEDEMTFMAGFLESARVFSVNVSNKRPSDPNHLVFVLGFLRKTEIGFHEYFLDRVLFVADADQQVQADAAWARLLKRRRILPFLTCHTLQD